MTTRASQMRREPRFALRLHGLLLVQGQRVECLLRDLSRGGACVDADLPLAVGKVVVLARGALSATARIVWSRGTRLGLAFDTPIRATELLLQMAEGRAPDPPAISVAGDASSRSPSSRGSAARG